MATIKFHYNDGEVDTIKNAHLEENSIHELLATCYSEDLDAFIFMEMDNDGEVINSEMIFRSNLKRIDVVEDE